MESNILKTFIVRVNSIVQDKISEEELIELIIKISELHQHKKFGYFDEGDMQGQVWVICLEQLCKYEVSKGIGTSTLNSIERWLNRVVKHRLVNFHRDNYCSVNPQYRANRVNLINTLGIDNIDITREDNAKETKQDPCEFLIVDELFKFVEERLTDDLKEIYHACLEDENVSSYYKSKLSASINDILVEWKQLNKGF